MVAGSRGRTRIYVHDVSTGLRNVSNLMALSDLELARLPVVQERARTSRALFAEARVVSELLNESARSVLGRIPAGDARLQRVARTIEGVLAGKSIAQIAREHHCRREYWSRSVWKQAVTLIAHELAERSGAVLVP